MARGGGKAFVYNGPFVTGGGGGSPAWDPLTDAALSPGLVCDICPDYSSTVTLTSGVITRINDRTSYANDFESTTSTNGPGLTTKDASFANRNTMAFTGAQELRSVNPFNGVTSNGTVTVCAVFMVTSSADQFVYQAGATFPPTNGPYNALLSGSYYHRGYRVGSPDINYNQGSTALSTPVHYVWTTDLKSAAPVAATYLNGTLLGGQTGASGAGINLGADKWMLASSSGSFYMVGKFARFLVWNRILSAAEITALEAGLTSFYTAPAATTYLGQVATRSAMQQDFNAGITKMMCRTHHRSRDAIANPTLIFANWYGKTEQAPGGAATITASIEYPSGTFTQVTFSGSATGTIPNGGQLTSDPVPVSIPDDAKFYVRSFYQNAAGSTYCGRGGDTTNGDHITYGAGAVDATMSDPLPTLSSANIMYPPVAILGLTKRPSVYIAGDSRGFGNTDIPNTSLGLIGEVARSVGPSRAFINGSCSGETAAEFVANRANRTALYGYCSHVVCEYGINDINGGATAAATKANLAAVKALFPSKPVWQTTLAPETNSTDSWATTINQTALATESVRTTVNGTIRTNALGFNGVYEVADIMETARDSGIWKAPNYTGDGIHETNTANIAIVTAGIIDPSVYTR